MSIEPIARGALAMPAMTTMPMVKTRKKVPINSVT
jgi:hypothetical protein